MVDLIPPNLLDPEGNPDGRFVGLVGGVPTWVDPTGAGNDLGWYNVKDFGATGVAGDDALGPVNDTIAAINGSSADGAALYFPPGVFDPSAGFDTIEKPTTIFGMGCADSHFRAAPTSIRLASGTDTLFTIGTAAHGSNFSQLNLVNIAGSAPTAGSAIHVLGGDGASYQRLTVAGFYDNLDMEDGQEWTMERCFIYSPVRYGMRIRHVDLTDGGDMGLDNCYFLAGDYDAAAAIRWESGGGLRLANSKINTRTLSHFFQCGLDATFTGFTTVDLNIDDDCSFENVDGPFIRGRLGAFGEFYQATIGGQFAYYSTTAESAIDIDGWNNVTIVGATAVAKFSGSSGPFAKLANIDHLTIGPNNVDGFAGGEFSATSCTNVVTPSTLAAEDVRDIIGAALVEGTGIDITVDDAGDTITIAATITGGEVLMQDGVTGPPVPIETEARDDWLYSG